MIIRDGYVVLDSLAIPLADARAAAREILRIVDQDEMERLAAERMERRERRREARVAATTAAQARQVCSCGLRRSEATRHFIRGRCQTCYQAALANGTCACGRAIRATRPCPCGAPASKRPGAPREHVYDEDAIRSALARGVKPTAIAAALGIPERVVRWVRRSAHGEATR